MVFEIYKRDLTTDKVSNEIICYDENVYEAEALARFKHYVFVNALMYNENDVKAIYLYDGEWTMEKYGMMSGLFGYVGSGVRICKAEFVRSTDSKKLRKKRIDRVELTFSEPKMTSLWYHVKEKAIPNDIRFNKFLNEFRRVDDESESEDCEDEEENDLKKRVFDRHLGVKIVFERRY